MRVAILATISAVLITLAVFLETGFGAFTSYLVLIAWIAAGDAWYQLRRERTKESPG
jgi:hypothetical protein